MEHYLLYDLENDFHYLLVTYQSCVSILQYALKLLYVAIGVGIGAFLGEVFEFFFFFLINKLGFNPS